MVGLPTGWVLEWHEATGWKKVPDSDGAMPNGIEASADGEALYVDLYLGDEVRKISRKTGETLATVDIASPDNVLWSPDGSLLVASHNAPIREVLACGEIEHGACPFYYSIVQLDPDTLKPRALYENAGSPMGGGTAALRVGDELIIGTFAGDRIVRAKIAP
jgi:DNA-binding beta-propeller fold protein YncE